MEAQGAMTLRDTLRNVAGISIAARGLLSPVVCAILMPLSSATVVVFASAVTAWLGRRALGPPAEIAAEGNDAERPAS
jgi:hypothetical protein